MKSSGDLLADRRYAYASASLDEGDAAACADLAMQTVEIAPHWAAGWFLLGKARAELGQPGLAADAFRRALAADPRDELGAGIELALVSGDAQADTDSVMSPAYVASLFDAYAHRFDTHLASLDYRAPDLLWQRLSTLGPFARVLDLGCGTGLMGARLRSISTHLAGCDLSADMVRQATRRAVYDTLAVADLGAFMADEAAESASLVVAADVFVYLGDLAPAFGSAARVLKPGGWLAFTVQAPSDETDAGRPHLGEDRRFHHGQRYISGLCPGLFAIVASDRVTLRRDRGEPVEGDVMVLRRL